MLEWENFPSLSSRHPVSGKNPGSEEGPSTLALVPPLVVIFEHAGVWCAKDPLPPYFPGIAHPRSCGRQQEGPTLTGHRSPPSHHTSGHLEACFLLDAAVAFDPADHPFFPDTSPSESGTLPWFTPFISRNIYVCMYVCMYVCVYFIERRREKERRRETSM